MSDRGLSATELADVARGVKRWDDDPRGTFVPQAMLDDLARWIPGMALAFGDVDVRTATGVRFQDGDPDAPPERDDPAERRALYRNERCRAYLYGEGHLRRTDVVRTFDMYTQSEWRNCEAYAEHYVPLGEWNHLICPVAPPPGHSRNIMWMRSRDEGVFSDRDRDLAILLQPHIVASCERRLREAPPDLTPTQWQVLRYLDEGLSTREIAEAMYVSPSTVRKHVENIFNRLNVTSRVAALARAFGARATT
ncbi:MAG TPA: LuxR C-terminal-related transcriptional regulator [Mycobacteriales bacterium]|nr:LuxR C-terminal-related transcriptional regulator [Mycobacteriales bacterium]